MRRKDIKRRSCGYLTSSSTFNAMWESILEVWLFCLLNGSNFELLYNIHGSWDRCSSQTGKGIWLGSGCEIGQLSRLCSYSTAGQEIIKPRLRRQKQKQYLHQKYILLAVGSIASPLLPESYRGYPESCLKPYQAIAPALVDVYSQELQVNGGIAKLSWFICPLIL